MAEHELDKITDLISEIEKVILGKRDVIQLTVAALLAGGHVLFEDIPGVGKTILVKSLAKAIHSDFSRIQFTPDLLPSDILGISIFDAQTNQFDFRAGPIFTTILLADEINRTTPRTQAALLEAMSEGHVTIDNQTYALNPHFFVLATQNPISYSGTYPLPEAQLDRFLFRLHIGYPAFSDELELITGKRQQSLALIQPVLTLAELTELKQKVTEVYVDDAVARYALQLVEASRNHPAIDLGISPRGSIAFIQGAKAYALTEKRSFVTPGDLQKILPAVFAHRLILREGLSIEEVIHQIIDHVPVPVRS
ncbi:AAA family ATPase [Enterococcus devriesei]|uniref:ATPase n=1 Tax=Enterococcus devriesei TaxID=319970 RepID=A0A1L8SMM4_9ENTE|nr:MoxR family ATPase [Enterococcus devriesei]MDU6522692.1 MoxR family ATPase [Enterococcus sp.]OJG33261.1 ATPase [Enterococcus devriesei]